MGEGGRRKGKGNPNSMLRNQLSQMLAYLGCPRSEGKKRRPQKNGADRVSVRGPQKGYKRDAAKKSALVNAKRKRRKKSKCGSLE